MEARLGMDAGLFSSERRSGMKKLILNPIGMLLSGLLLGVLSRCLDVYTTNLGNIFSQLAVWILFGVLISIYSSTKGRADYINTA
mgnify:CR=1 FL=1